MNQENEQAYHESKRTEKEKNNPWQIVINNVEINSAQYVGGCDVTRMRAAMISRKNDLTKGGATGMQKLI